MERLPAWLKNKWVLYGLSFAAALLLLLIQLLVGMVVYGLGSFVFKLEAFNTIREMGINYIAKKKF